MKYFREATDLITARNKMRKLWNRVTCSLPLEVQKDLAPVREIENGDDDLKLQEDVPSSLD
jgi:hypothetical protein